MGQEVNASPGVCKRFRAGKGREPLVYARGVVGPLDLEQQERLCESFVAGESDAFVLGAEKFRLLSSVAAPCLGKDVPVDQFLRCVFREASKRVSRKGRSREPRGSLE